MKNTVKLLSMMFAVGAMMFASCTPEPEPDPQPTTPQYTITVVANNDAYGTVTGGGVYDSAATATLTATPNEGYKFVNWSDGNESNPRLITVNANATYTANFAELSGVNVTFGEASWTAQYTNARYYVGTNNAIVIAATQSANSSSYPMFFLQHTFEGTPTTGTYTGNASISEPEPGSYAANTGNPFLTYFENEEENITLTYSNGSQMITGGWWSKNLTVNITVLDADNMNISLVANATMGHASECFDNVNWDNVTTRSLTLNVINQSMTTGAGKTFLKNHGIAKISH